MVESISDLRKICQSPVKGKDGEFCDIWYRPISIYLTKLLLYTPITSNQVTMLSMIVGMLGGILMIFSTNLWDILGVLLLQLFWILDFVDGEVARYRKSGSLTGEYFDFMAHYIVWPTYLMGMSLGAYADVKEVWIFIFGFSAAISISLEKDVTGVMYWVICNEKKNKLYKGIKEETFDKIAIQEQDSYNSKRQHFSIKEKAKVFFENHFNTYPKLKVTLKVFGGIFLLGGICSEMGILLTIFIPLVADIIWDGIVILDTHYRFMTLYLVLLGGLFPFLIISRIKKNISNSIPDKEYRELFTKY